MPLIASVTVASFAAIDVGIATMTSSNPRAATTVFVFMSVTSGPNYTPTTPLKLRIVIPNLIPNFDDEPKFCNVLNDGRPDSSIATTSPSITVSSGSPASAFNAKYPGIVKSLLFRDRRCTLPFKFWALTYLDYQTKGCPSLLLLLVQLFPSTPGMPMHMSSILLPNFALTVLVTVAGPKTRAWVYTIDQNENLGDQFHV
jgi:hypothetical protein